MKVIAKHYDGALGDGRLLGHLEPGDLHDFLDTIVGMQVWDNGPRRIEDAQLLTDREGEATLEVVYGEEI